MRAVLCDRFEGIGALRVGEAAEPVPANDEVLIDVHAASVSYMDYLMALGGYQMRPALPYVPGTDAAGVVVAVGDKVARFRPRDRVACSNWLGGFAERMVAKASDSARLPDNVDFVTGSAVLHAYLTAWYALVGRARLAPSDVRSRDPRVGCRPS
jgi:NADPH2:quinone reductase